MTNYHDYMNTHKIYPDDISRRIDIPPGFDSVREKPTVKESLTTALDENGLVPCGCGGEAKIWPSDPDNWTKRSTWWVECKKCGLAIWKWHDEDFSEERGWYDSAEEAVHAANRAMGYKEADE